MQTPPERLKHFVIAGGGTAGWMTAAFLTRYLSPAQARVTLVESAEIGTVGVGEATIPPIRNFNHALGINEAEFLNATQGTFKLGIEFDGWREPGHRYMHAFGYAGAKIAGFPFLPFWLKARANGQARDYAHYSLSSQAAYAGRFDWPDANASSPKAALSYAYHFDAGLYAGFLRKLAEARGVVRIEGQIADVQLDPSHGGIDRLRLDDGRVIAGDFFFDCTGFRALLIGQALGIGYDDWSDHLPVNRAVAVQTERMTALKPYTRALARPAGWQWRIPLQHRTGNGYVYVSDHISDDAALADLLAEVEGPATAEPRFLRFVTGCRREAWVKNCLAVGLSSGFLEPLESTSIHLIQNGLTRLSGLFPSGRDDAPARQLYNRGVRAEMENVRDFLVFHYHANGRAGEPLWDHLRHMPITESLQEKIDLFQARGHAEFPGQTVFQPENWISVMLGQGLAPRTYDPLIDGVPEAAFIDVLNRIARDTAATVARMPMHDDVLKRLSAMVQRV